MTDCFQEIALIPAPQRLERRPGRLVLSLASTITWRGEKASEVAELLAEYLRPATGFPFLVREGNGGTLHLEAAGAGMPDAAGFVDEQYALHVDGVAARLTASNATGLARGIQTLRQLLPAEIFSHAVQGGIWELPAVEIEDAPRFRWRGQHLDVCRHFFSVQEVCKFIDLLALHRLNICHLHLTEDQGWRIEIQKYPRLTEIGSVREKTLIGHERDRPRRYDGQGYGGFYTQADIRALVAFAARRHITLVPEIDMPGHMVAALTAYPALGNFKTEHRVRCHWGISQSVLNVEETTVAFMKDVLTEVMDLFPGRFIHIGGDEAPKFEWSESERAQQRMAELGLTNEHELQSWFIRQMSGHIQAAGRQLIGWNEILEGGLAEGAAVMSWQGEKGGLAAAALGHDVVMAPNQWVYFDYYQAEPRDQEPLAIGGYTPLEKVYSYEPVPVALPVDQQHHILGAQGQLWTEYMPTMAQVEYMGFPRICALAENLWLNADRKNFEDFRARLTTHQQRLALLGVRAHHGSRCHPDAE